MKRLPLLLLLLASTLLLVPGILRLYLMMPFPGSQELLNSLPLAYMLYKSYLLLRLLGIVAIVGALIYSRGQKSTRIASSVAVVLALLLTLAEHYVINPARMFREMTEVRTVPAQEAQWSDSLKVIGVEVGGHTVAVPVYVVAYHHRIPLSMGNKKMWITYCSMCGTGTVFDLTAPSYRSLQFDLIGMNRYNALFEDTKTGTWWHQDTGEAIYGERKGDALPLYGSQTLRWSEWRKLHPHTQALLPHPDFTQGYESFAGLKYRTPPIRVRR